MSPKRLIIYDLDGTLVDTKQDITEAANAMLSQFGAAPLSQQEVCRFVGSGLRQLIKGCLRIDDTEKIEKGILIYRTYYRDHLLDHTALYPFAREVLEYFKQRNQAVVTNKPNPFSQNILIGLGVADYFLEIVTGDSEYGKKPDPAAVKAIMKKAGVSAEETLLVGDSPIDVETGRNAQILTVGVSQGFSDEQELRGAFPDLFVRNLQEFLEMAKKEGW